MAKKTVASLHLPRDYQSHQDGEISKTGAYTFVESIMAPELVEEFLKELIKKSIT
jgi:hypothetical protein